MTKKVFVINQNGKLAPVDFGQFNAGDLYSVSFRGDHAVLSFSNRERILTVMMDENKVKPALFKSILENVE